MHLKNLLDYMQLCIVQVVHPSMFDLVDLSPDIGDSHVMLEPLCFER